MKKTFLKFVFAATMGISLFLGTTKSANAETIISGNEISMTTNDTHTFEGNVVTLDPDSTSVKLEGKKITPIDVGESIVYVDGTKYTITVSLPSNYTQLDYVLFNRECALDTGFKPNGTSGNANLKIAFNYSGLLENETFGIDNGDCFLGLRSGKMHTGIHGKTVGSSLNGTKNEKTLFDFTLNGSQANLVCGEDEYSATYADATCKSSKSFVLGYLNGPYSDRKTYRLEAKIYDFYIEENDTAFLKYIPSFNNSTFQIGFYDLISKTFIAPFEGSLFSSNGILPLSYVSDSYTISPDAYNNMYLPTNVDYTNLNGSLNVENGTILTGDIPGASLTVGVNNLDFTSIFQQIDGKFNVLVMRKDGIICSYTLLIASNVADVFLTCDQTYDYLTQSKDNFTSGNFVFKDGLTTYACGLANMHGRGNHFTHNEKNNFSLKLDTSLSLIPGAGSQKKYVLLGLATASMDYMMPQVGFSLYQQLCKNGDDIHYRMVNVWYNGTCLGLHMLLEKVRIDSNIVNINEPDMDEGTVISQFAAPYTGTEKDLLEIFNSGIQYVKFCRDAVVREEGGFIIEAGKYISFAKSGFTTSHGNTWEIKEPEGISLSQLKKIAIHIQKAEDALFSETGFNSYGEHYSNLYDLDSIAREFLVRSFTKDVDFYKTSNYLYVNGNETGIIGKIYAGPIWDLDTYRIYDYEKFYYGETGSSIAYQFRDKLMEKGDFVSLLNSINSTEFGQMVKNMVDPNYEDSDNIYDFYDEYLSARKNDDTIWNHNIAKTSLTNKTQIITACNYWENFFKPDTYLLGVTVKHGNGTELIAEANNASDYQWFQINEQNESVLISGATSSSYTPTNNGKYYVQVTGAPLPGVPTDTMNSNPINVGSCTVCFDMLGHGSQIPSQNVSVGGSVTKPIVSFENGYVFRGWYKESACTNRWIFSTDVVTEDTTLYAKWVQGGTLFKDTSISLKDNTWLNMYTECIDDDYTDYKFTYSLHNAANPTESAQIAIESGMFQKIGSEWRISVALKPDQMADVITIYMYDLSDHLICTKTDSIRSYAMSVINSTNPGVTQAMKDACIALLNYGAAVQQLTGYNSGDLANKDLKSN